MKYLSFIFFSLISSATWAQSQVCLPVSFDLWLNQQSLRLEGPDNTSPLDSLNIEVLKVYISQLTLFDGGEKVFTEENSFHLLDFEDPKSLSFHLSVPDSISFSHLRFHVGIDSLTNVSGAFGGELDPTKGMYWTWQSGFINFKLEGRAKGYPTRHNRFQFHIGGYQYPFNSLQMIELELFDQEAINIHLALDDIFDSVDLDSAHQIMSPSEHSVTFSHMFQTLFSIEK